MSINIYQEHFRLSFYFREHISDLKFQFVRKIIFESHSKLVMYRHWLYCCAVKFAIRSTKEKCK